MTDSDSCLCYYLCFSWRHWSLLNCSWRCWSLLNCSWRHWSLLNCSWRHWSLLNWRQQQPKERKSSSADNMELILPDLIISKDLIERIQFSVSSRNAQAKLSKCAVHIFAAPYPDDPHNIEWQYVSSGVTCLLRNRELVKNGRRYMWSINLCLYNASYGVLVWKAKLSPNSDYTDVADNFHVFAFGEVNVLVGLMFSETGQACEHIATYTMWNQEREKDDGKRGYISRSKEQDSHVEPIKFDKNMISKPCNFQHIQGTQAIEECLDIEKIKSDIVASFFGMGTKVGRSGTISGNNGAKSKKKKEPVKPKLEFKDIELPHTQSSISTAFTSSAISSDQDCVPSSTENPLQEGMCPGEMLPSTNGCSEVRSYDDMNSHEDNPMAAQRLHSPHGQSDATDPGSYPGGLVAGAYYPNQNQGHVAELSHGLSSQVSSMRDDQLDPPNFQNPSSPSYQEYKTIGQSKISYDVEPPRFDMSLEKELAESPIFKPSLMTANWYEDMVVAWLFVALIIWGVAYFVMSVCVCVFLSVCAMNFGSQDCTRHYQIWWFFNYFFSRMSMYQTDLFALFLNCISLVIIFFLSNWNKFSYLMLSVLQVMFRVFFTVCLDYWSDAHYVWYILKPILPSWFPVAHLLLSLVLPLPIQDHPQIVVPLTADMTRPFLLQLVVGLGQWLLEHSWWPWL